MSRQGFYSCYWAAPALILLLLLTGCASRAPQPDAATSPPPATVPPTEGIAETTSAPVDQPVLEGNVLYADTFTDPASGWPSGEFDNYYIGYHEPEYYHVEISNPNYRTSVFTPGKETFTDMTIEVKAFIAASRTAETGDSSFGIAFRRSGDEYYAFAISQRTKTWYVLKSSPDALVVLSDGLLNSINPPDVGDLLRVDAQGSNFSFSINGEHVTHVSDSDYATGEVGLYVQSFDVTNVHVHFDELSIRVFEGEAEAFLSQSGERSFMTRLPIRPPAGPRRSLTIISSGTTNRSITTSRSQALITRRPSSRLARISFGDISAEVKAFTAASKTAETGDFSFGLAFRRSGDEYYAFAISQRAKTWHVLKSSPTALTVLAEGTHQNIHDFDVEDVLRVDALGSDFSFYINEELVGQVSDSDYAAGEVGFYVQSLDVTTVHIHFDELTINPAEGMGPQEFEGALYFDTFTDPATAWPEEEFDNYFIGYHEPEYYHVEVLSPNSRTAVFTPDHATYDDVSVEVKAFTASSRTAEAGDFSFGVAFRRTGDEYYAFAISQRAKQWYVLKSSPNALAVLAEGTMENIHDPDEEDVLRVDSQGPNFSFYINDELVNRVADSAYGTGEVGLYVQTFDVPAVHVHFDTLVIRPFKSSITCEVAALMLNVREGPGTRYPPSTFLSNGDMIEPFGRNENGDWLVFVLEGEGNYGWVSNTSTFLSCNAPVDILPLTSP
jgi:hypothetical protein